MILELIYPASGVLLLAWAIQSWGRWAGGGGWGWVLLGVALASFGFDACRQLVTLFALAPEPVPAPAVVGPLAALLAWRGWREWRRLGERAEPRPASPDTMEA